VCNPAIAALTRQPPDRGSGRGGHLAPAVGEPVSGLPDLRGKAAVVTGGASGIGRGIATRLIGEGMQVVIADIEESALGATAANIGAIGISVDVSDEESVQALAGEAVRRLGAVHVVCNNAGVGPMAPVASLTMDDWHWLIGVNLYGVIHGVQAFLPVLEANPDGGHIVNTASMAGLVAPAGLGAYSVTKYGVVALTEVLAAELAAAGSKVGISVLCPGTVSTNIGTSSRNRPPRFARGGLEDVDIALENRPAHRWITPEQAGDVVVRAVKRGDLYALTHPDWYPMVERRHDTIAAAFRQAAADRAVTGDS
jgi:NAD(P)-dependent dehydrogenase (short-subunit alcohol dehydrogenase family)